MNVNKRNKYIASIYGALHTVSGHCKECDMVLGGMLTTVKDVRPRRPKNNQDEYKFYVQLNPNNDKSGDMIRSYSEFCNVLNDSLDFMAASGFKVNRADMSINSDNEDDYELFKKLNRLLVCCIADERNIKNCYQTKDLWSYKSLSVAIKNEYIEVENYDKGVENPNVKTKNRLELRSKRMMRDLEKEFTKKWFERLDAAVNHFDSVQERYNAELEQIWKKDREKPEKDRDFVSVTAFLMQFRECLFTKKQLRDLMGRIGVKNPDVSATKFKERHRIEFFSLTDLKEIVKAIKHTISMYFES